MNAVLPEPAWLVGCGNMAGAMVAGWQAAGVDLAEAIAIRPSGRAVPGMKTRSDLPPDGTPAFVMLGVKPQKLDEVVPALAPRLGPGTILVSILAGVSVATLRQRFANVRAVIRAMPNLPVAHNRGVIALFGEDHDATAYDAVDALMRPLGTIIRCAAEEEFAAIGAVAGAGPAYVAAFAQALAVGGERLGLDPEIATRIAMDTLVGTAAMADPGGASAEDIRRRVASPNGTTERGLAVLDAADGLQPLVDRMLVAARERGRELAAEAAARS